VDELYIRCSHDVTPCFRSRNARYMRSVLEVLRDQFLATCDRCGRIVFLATSDLTTARDLLRVRGWAERAGKSGGGPSYEWSCAACTARSSM
jgi:hypothetical protein